MKFILYATGVLFCQLVSAQSPLPLDSTGAVVYYAEFPMEKGKEAKAEDIFTRFINLNFNKYGSALFFKNAVTHHFTASCYFSVVVNELPSPADVRFKWFFCINDGKIQIYLYNLDYQSWQNSVDAPSSMTGEWINDFGKSSILATHVAEKIDSQMKHYIQIFKESLVLLDK
jgi:hypothetical protein